MGERPAALLPLAAPTLLSIVIDLVLRGGDFIIFEPHGKAIYFSALLVSSAFWIFPLLCAARAMNGEPRPVTRVGLAVFFAAWVFPLLVFGYGEQLAYFRVFHTYMGRDTLRLGALLRGGYVAWFRAWGGLGALAASSAFGVVGTFALYRLVRRQAPHLADAFPRLPIITFLGALFCFWTDNVDSRFLQAATPDTCFVNGAAHALRAATTGTGRVREGVTLRNPTPLPPLTSARKTPPNVLFVITESVRADALCSDPSSGCTAQFLDAPDVARDRISLGKLTTQTPNTFSSCMILWTGLEPNVDFVDAHEAPVLWELARGIGYRTAYVTSQNAKYEDFGVYVHNAGIEYRQTATELGGMAHEQLGAPDERAVASMLSYLHAAPPGSPYFAVLHLANTHQPYRVDPALQPNAPHEDSLAHGVGDYQRHYRNSVLMQERLVAGFLREVRTLPSWDDTVVVFVSDHGDQFGEHGSVHHNHNLWDVELRVPGFVIAGANALSEPERAALRTYAGTRTYSEDVHETIVDLFGLEPSRGALPFHSEVVGRSLLRARNPRREPSPLLSTASGVWEPNDPWFGAMHGEQVLTGTATTPWRCFDMIQDPGEQHALPASACGGLLGRATHAFPGIGAPR